MDKSTLCSYTFELVMRLLLYGSADPLVVRLGVASFDCGSIHLAWPPFHACCQTTSPHLQVLAVGEAYARETRALLLRASLLQHDVVQRSGGRGGKGGAGGGGGSGGGGFGGGGGGGPGGDDRGPRRGGRERAGDREGRGGGGGGPGSGSMGALALMGAHVLAELTGGDGGGGSAGTGGSSGAGE